MVKLRRYRLLSSGRLVKVGVTENRLARKEHLLPVHPSRWGTFSDTVFQYSHAEGKMNVYQVQGKENRVPTHLIDGAPRGMHVPICTLAKVPVNHL